MFYGSNLIYISSLDHWFWSFKNYDRSLSLLYFKTKKKKKKKKKKKDSHLKFWHFTKFKRHSVIISPLMRLDKVI